MPGKPITCLYCFNEFKDEEVHFRMETVFSEDELDPKNEGRSKSELLDREEIREYELREAFLAREDERYEAFWQEFGGTTEKPSVSRDGKAPRVQPYLRPVFNPNNVMHSIFFGQPWKDSDVINAYGMVYAAFDCFGKKTERRVCPHCHNPLPGLYGKFPVKFISIIGITGAGKTVYLSQLCKYISHQISYFGITATPTSIYPQEYLEANPVVMGKPLPTGSPPERFLQPLCFDLQYQGEDRERHHTVVFYDIAGENCVNHEKMKGFGRFVEHADSIVLVIDPEQFNLSSDADRAVKVLETIYTVFGNKHPIEVRSLLIAISISKGDKIAHEVIHKNLEDIRFLEDKFGSFLPQFNAEDYNPIHDAIKEFVQRNSNELHTRMRNLYDNYNYFLFSSIGTSTETVENGSMEFETPAGPPIPKRILEPIAWLLYKYGFLSASGLIHEPKDWFCPSCGKRLRVSQSYCLDCKVNGNGEWKCPNCGEMNAGEWCDTPKCKTDRFGKKKSFFSR